MALKQMDKWAIQLGLGRGVETWIATDGRGEGLSLADFLFRRMDER